MRGLVALIVTFVLVTSSAAARPFPPEVQSMYQEAIAYWSKPPELCTSMTLELLPPEDFPYGVNGTGTEPDRPMPCVVTVNEDQPPCEMKTTLRHEVGHTEGYGHSADPLSVMYWSPLPLFCEAKTAQHELRIFPRELARCRRIVGAASCRWLVREREELRHHIFYLYALINKKELP